MRLHYLPALAALSMAAAMFLPVAPAAAQSGATGSTGSEGASTAGAPIRLRQPQAPAQASTSPADKPGARPADRLDDFTDDEQSQQQQRPRYRPGEFERYMQRLTNDRTLRRFGTDLVIDAPNDLQLARDAEPQVPPDYRVAPGDELIVNLWGALDADLRLTVDRTGRIGIPRIGSVMVAGLPASEVAGAIDKQARKVFKNFEVAVALGQLRSVRLFVTGFALRPGAYTVSSLSTLSSVLLNRAGGPSPAGSFRDIELRRGGQTVAKLDLYDLLIFGRRDSDHLVRADDVIHVGPVGRQVALIGSVNKAAIFELKPAETVADLLRMGGGANSVADRSRAAVERLSERNDRRVRQLTFPEGLGEPLDAGDVVRVFSAIDAQLPLQRQNKRVRVEGEVLRPGTYILPPETTILDAVQAAGGMTPAAYVYGTDFSRETVRQTQQANFERALRDFEVELSRREAGAAIRTAEEGAAQEQQRAATERMLARLREAKPSGRVVLQLAEDARELPALALEDGDRILIPPRPTTVGVFGSVFNAGSYLFGGNRKVGDYLRLAGSPTQGANKEGIYVIRANGSVVSAQQKQGWFSGANIDDAPSLPGDTVFVPEEANKTTFLQAAKDWTQVLYQLGLGLASIRLMFP